MYYVIRYRIKVVRENLNIVFPEKDKSEKRKIEQRFYRHFSDYIAETIKGLTMDDEELMKRMVILNPEFINQYTNSGRSVFVYGAHFGNWEWFTVFPLNFTNCGVQAFYQQQSNKLMNDITVESRSRNKIVPVESHRGFRHMVECMKRGENNVTLVLGDQSPHRGAKKYWTNFFGQDTAFLMGVETIAKRTNQVLVFPSYKSYSRGHYEVEMKLIEDDPANVDGSILIDRFAAYLEDDIRSIPELWLWSHRRWKHKHENFPD